MKPIYLTLFLAAPSLFVHAQGQAPQPSPTNGVTSPATAIGFVRLQPSSPGTAQAGNSHITGKSMASAFEANNPNGSAVVGTGENGVVGLSSTFDRAGLYGQNYPGFGVVGRSNFVGVWGDNVGGHVGVHGASIFGSSGYGVFGEGSFAALYGVGGTYGVVSDGDAYVAGDLVVTGSKTGYVVDLVKNGDTVPLEPGDLVEIVGSEPAVLGDIPLVVVRRASSANARAVLGPISNAIEVGSEVERPANLVSQMSEVQSRAQLQQKPGILRIQGAIRPGKLGNVVTLGAFSTIKVDARYGVIRPGDLLVASPEPGFAMSSSDPLVGTIVGKALGAWSTGQGEIPVMVSNR